MRGVDIFFGIVCACLIVGCLGLLIPAWVAPFSAYEFPMWWFEASFFHLLIGAFLIVPAIDLVGSKG